MTNTSYAVIGHPLGHTMSPPIHRRLFELAGLSADYRVIEIPPDALSSHIPALYKLSGFNVTIPHKQAIIPFLTCLDPTAAMYGAVNTVMCSDGQTRGYNTDIDGVLHTIDSLGSSLYQHTLLLGSGGAARMIAIECAKKGGHLTVLVRNTESANARALKQDLSRLCPGAQVCFAEPNEIKERYDLLINATPVGMFPHADSCPVTEEIISLCDCVFDLVYNPVDTRLLVHARRLGKPALGGMTMLVWQAVAAHQIWHHGQYSPDDITSLIAQMEAQVKKEF